MEKYFTVLPYITVIKPFRFGEFDIWPDEEKNWRRYAKLKRPASLLNIYVGRDGKRIANKTIITSREKFKSDRLRELVSTLFFLPSKRYFFATTAEAFYYETYINNKQKGVSASHTRVDKFAWSLVYSRGFKIYQSFEASFSKFELKESETEYFAKLRRFFNDKAKSHIVRSLPFYFRTQYRNLSLFPEIEDIQNYCTAFEIFFKEKNRVDVGLSIAKKLFSFFSLADEIERKALKEWFRELYEIRGDYTHGRDIEAGRLIYNNQRHIEIAKQVYCECVSKCLKPQRGMGRKILSSDNSLLIKLFSSQEVYKSVIKMLTNGWGKSQSGVKSLDYLLTCVENELGLLLSLFYKFTLYVNKKTIEFGNKKRLKMAMETTLAVLNHFVEVYDKRKYKKEFYIEVLQDIKKLPLFPKTDSEFESNYHFLKNPTIKYNEIIGDLDNVGKVKFRDELKLRGLIDISLFSQVYVDLYEVYRGWM